MTFPDVVVIGGGIIGTSAAAFLAEGGLRVQLVERDGLASGASGANSGVIQLPFDPVFAPLYAETMDLYEALGALDAGFRLPARPAGLLFVSRDAASVTRLAAEVAHDFPSLDPEVLDEAALAALEPALARGLVGYRVALGHPVAPAASTYAYATLAERRGVTIRMGRAARPEMVGGRVVGARIGDELVPAGAVLVACGPWTPEAIDPTGRWRPIEPIWGVVVEATLANPPGHVLEEAEIDAALAGAADTDAAPAAAGVLGEPQVTAQPVARDFSLGTLGGMSSVGSTFLRRQPDPSRWIVPLMERGASFVPGLAQAPIRGVRACARPRSLDGHPLVGSLPGVDGLFVCAGHGPWGISTGPATARIVADRILGRPVEIPAELQAGRFGSPFEV